MLTTCATAIGVALIATAGYQTIDKAANKIIDSVLDFGSKRAIAKETVKPLKAVYKDEKSSEDFYPDDYEPFNDSPEDSSGKVYWCFGGELLKIDKAS